MYCSRSTSRQRLSQGDDAVRVSEGLEDLDRELNDEEVRLLELGRQDTTTPVTVTVTVHTTPEFRYLNNVKLL